MLQALRNVVQTNLLFARSKVFTASNALERLTLGLSKDMYLNLTLEHVEKIFSVGATNQLQL